MEWDAFWNSDCLSQSIQIEGFDRDGVKQQRVLDLQVGDINSKFSSWHVLDFTVQVSGLSSPEALSEGVNKPPQGLLPFR